MCCLLTFTYALPTLPNDPFLNVQVDSGPSSTGSGGSAAFIPYGGGAVPMFSTTGGNTSTSSAGKSRKSGRVYAPMPAWQQE